MRLETFFEKFELFAEAPGAVAELRKVILTLAVQGKLVSQDPKEDSALVQLNQISSLKKSMAKEGKFRGSTSVSPLDRDACRFKLPVGWAWVRFGEIMLNRDGERIPVSKEERETKQKIFDYYGASGIIDKIDGFLFDKPLLLIGEDGANLINRSTPIAFIARGKYWVNNHAHVLDGISENFLKFIELQINSINLEKYVTGSAQPKLNQAKMNGIPIALPPASEQIRICSKVGELMNLVDQLEIQQQEREARIVSLSRASLDRFSEAPTPANLNFIFHKSYDVSPAELRKAILTLAVQGKLVPQERSEISIADSFSELKTFSEKSDIIREVPFNWTVCTYRSLTNLITSGSRGWKGFYSNSGSIFIRTQNIKTDILLLDDIAFVELPKSTEGMRTRVLKDDILITITGANVTKAARIREQLPDAFVSQHIALTRPRWPEFSKWLHLCFISSGSARGELEKLAYGDKPGLNLENIRNLILPIPPLPEQQRILTKVDQLMALVDQLESQLAESKTAGKHLLEALVSELAA